MNPNDVSLLKKKDGYIDIQKKSAFHNKLKSQVFLGPKQDPIKSNVNPKRNAATHFSEHNLANTNSKREKVESKNMNLHQTLPSHRM